MWFIQYLNQFLTVENKHGIWRKHWDEGIPFLSRSDADIAAFSLALKHTELMGRLLIVEVNVWVVTTSVGVGIVPSPPLRFGKEFRPLYWYHDLRSWSYGWQSATKYEGAGRAALGMIAALKQVPEMEPVAVVKHIDDVYAYEQELARKAKSCGTS